MAAVRFRHTLLLALAAGTIAGVPRLARADAAPAGGKAAQKQKTVQVLVAQGDAALEVKSYAAARDAFSDALTLDSGNTAALVGEALARMQLGQSLQAGEIIDKAADNGVPTRAVAINAAVIHVNGKDPMRAAKILKTYLSASATPHDERAYDLLITALSQFSSQAKGNYFYNACQTFAASYAEKLDKDRAGQKLWGVDWLPADEADRKAADFKTQQSTITAAEAKVASLDSQAASAQSRYDAIEQAYENRQASRYAVRAARDHLSDLQTQEKHAQDAADDAMAKVEQPPLLKSIDPLIPGESDQVASSSTPGNSATDTNAPPAPPAPPTPLPTPPQSRPATVVVAPPVEPPKKVAVTNYAVAVAIAPTLAITDASAVKDSNSFSLQCPDGTVVQGTLVRTDSTGKLALLQLNKKVAYLDLASTFTGGPLTCTGFPEVNIFNPTAEGISGTAPAPGDDWEIKLSKHPRLGGAPLTTTAGKVVGVELAARDSAITKIPAVSIEAIRSFVGSDLPAPGHGTASPSGAIFQLVSTSEP